MRYFLLTSAENGEIMTSSICFQNKPQSIIFKIRGHTTLYHNWLSRYSYFNNDMYI